MNIVRYFRGSRTQNVQFENATEIVILSTRNGSFEFVQLISVNSDSRLKYCSLYLTYNIALSVFENSVFAPLIKQSKDVRFFINLNDVPTESKLLFICFKMNILISIKYQSNLCT